LSAKAVILWERRSKRKAKKAVGHFHADFSPAASSRTKSFSSQDPSSKAEISMQKAKYFQLFRTKEISFY